MSERFVTREEGPVEILCREIGYHFDWRLERADIFVAFVQQLVNTVADMREMDERISPMTGKSPSADSGRVLDVVRKIFTVGQPDGMIVAAADAHDLIHEVAPEGKYPCDHLIAMLSLCVSAIRFGLERPCHSRHAASASNHIWKHRYGVTLFDSFTPAWEKDWARAQLREAITSMALERDAQCNTSHPQGGDNG